MIAWRWNFEAVMLADDKRTGYKRGRKLYPKGFYYNGKNVILVGSEKEGHTIRVSLPVDTVEVKCVRC